MHAATLARYLYHRDYETEILIIEIMRQRFLLSALVALLMATACPAQAQTYREDGYDFFYDYEHRIVRRSIVACTYDNQDLWNGDYVRIINGSVYIYRNGYRILYGSSIWLTHTGHYIVERGNYQYLYDEDGDYWTVSGNDINILWNGVYSVQRGDSWYLYTADGNRLGYVYSLESFKIYWNGYYCLYRGGYYYLADESGDLISGSYSDTEPSLLDNGTWRVHRGNYSYVIDSDGSRVY